MANALYALGKQHLLAGDFNLGSGGSTIKALLVDAASYTPDLTSTGDETLADVPAGSRIATSPAFTNPAIAAGIYDADDITFSAVTTGGPYEYVVIYLDSGTEATSYLLALIDTATGLPVTGNGGDVDVAWDNGANKIFAL